MFAVTTKSITYHLIWIQTNICMGSVSAIRS